MLRSDEELLEKEFKAAKSAVIAFCDAAQAARTPFFEKTANLLFGKRGEPDRAAQARGNAQRITAYAKEVVPETKSPKSFLAIEEELIYLTEQLSLVESERSEFNTDNFPELLKSQIPFAGSPEAQEDSEVLSLFVAATFAFDKGNPLGLTETFGMLNRLACLKILKIVALIKFLRAQRIKYLKTFYEEAESWPEHRLSIEIETRETKFNSLSRNTQEFRLKLFTITDFTVKIDQNDEWVLAKAVLQELRSIAHQKGNKPFLRQQTVEGLAATKQKEQAIADFVASLAPSQTLAPEDRVTEHLDRLTASIKEKLKMTQAQDEMLKQYPAEYHWYIKKAFRRAIEDLN